MDWRHLRAAPWLDTRARFVSRVPPKGTLLDLGSSDGGTLRHFAELRPDLRFLAVDIAGTPENHPAGCQFHRADRYGQAMTQAAASRLLIASGNCLGRNTLNDRRAVGNLLGQQHLLALFIHGDAEYGVRRAQLARGRQTTSARYTGS